MTLLRRHDVRLSIYGEGNPARFARRFRAAWKRLPLYVRCDLLRQWRHTRAVLGDGDIAVPNIELLSRWGGRRSGCLGQYRHAGGLGEMRFPPIVCEIPAEVAATVVAHELAHAWLHATGQEFSFGGFEEDEVDALLDDWGFDPDLLAEWCESNLRLLQTAGVERCGWCGERDTPAENPPFLRHLGNDWEAICPDCAKVIRADLAAGTRSAADFEVRE